MAKLNVTRMTESAEECLGWPYVSPGSNDERGIDCSGLFVKIYRDQGAKIYHGSNTIFREYCAETGKLTSISQLAPGMAVFKCKAWQAKDADNRWYGKAPGNLSHIGYVASVNPLRIIHASTGTMCVTTDTSISKWAYWGRLKAVDYGGGNDEKTPEKKEESAMYDAYLEGGNVKKPINIRVKPEGDLQDTVPQGTRVTVIAESGNWCKIEYRKGGRTVTGYVKGELVVVADDEPVDAGVPDEPVGGDDGNERVTVTLTMTVAEAAAMLPVLEKLASEIVDKAGRG